MKILMLFGLTLLVWAEASSGSGELTGDMIGHGNILFSSLELKQCFKYAKIIYTFRKHKLIGNY